MKKIVLFVVFFVFNLLLQAQESNFKKIDYKLVEKEVKNANSPYFYSKLQEKFNAADSTMTIEERRHFYYGYRYQDQYNPYATDDNISKLSKVLEKEELGDTELDQIITLGNDILKKNPFNLRVINYQLYAYEKKKDNLNLANKITQLRIIVDAILSTGKGTTAEDAIYVIDVSHEYDILGILGFQFGGEQSLIGSNDYLTLAENQYNIKGLYFDTSSSMESMMDLLEDNTFEKEDLIGSWKIVDFRHTLENKNESEKYFEKLFSNTILKFNSNQSFEFINNQTEKPILEITKEFQNKKWKYDSKKKEVKIGTSKDNYSIMSFKVEKKGTKVIFLMEETDFNVELIVEKQ